MGAMDGWEGGGLVSNDREKMNSTNIKTGILELWEEGGILFSLVRT